MPALDEVGLERSIRSVHIGDHQRAEVRSSDDPSQLVNEAIRVVYGLRVYLPAALVGAAVTRLIGALDTRLREWRRATHNTHLAVPIYAPDGTTVLRTVEVDSEPEAGPSGTFEQWGAHFPVACGLSGQSPPQPLARSHFTTVNGIIGLDRGAARWHFERQAFEILVRSVQTIVPRLHDGRVDADGQFEDRGDFEIARQV
jgi:hypothetical protein